MTGMAERLHSGDADDALAGAIRLQIMKRIGHRYAVGRELGRGASAIVFLARDRRLDRLVAIKVLRPDLVSSTAALRFAREIAILASLQHPNILPLHDCGFVEGMDYYVTPYVEGESLRQRLEREHRLPVADALRIAIDLADALAHLHQRGLVHRDVKPENILLSSGRAILADFGIAALRSPAPENCITRDGSGIPGTPLYMSPEQRFATDAVDGRADIYSLGLVLLEMLIGEVPRWSTMCACDEEKLLRTTHPLRWVRPDVSPAVEATIVRALRKDPDARFGAASDFAAALTQDAIPALALSQPLAALASKLSTFVSRGLTRAALYLTASASRARLGRGDYSLLTD